MRGARVRMGTRDRGVDAARALWQSKQRATRRRGTRAAGRNMAQRGATITFSWFSETLARAALSADRLQDMLRGEGEVEADSRGAGPAEMQRHATPCNNIFA